MSPRRNALLLSIALALAGCVSIGDKAELAVYAPSITVTADAAWPRTSSTLAIGEPNASAMLDGNRIAVRPTPAQLQVYSGAIWSDSAPDLVQATLIGAFAQGGHFAAVVRPTDGVGTDLLLRLDLRHFEAIYVDGADAPSVVVEMQATLVDQQRQRVVASRRFRAERPADGEKLPQVVPAFEAALGEVATAMLPWVLEGAPRDVSPPRSPAVRPAE